MQIVNEDGMFKLLRALVVQAWRDHRAGMPDATRFLRQLGVLTDTDQRKESIDGG